MQRKQVNSCSIVPLPHSSPIVGVADPWHYAAQTGELLLDRAPSLTHPRLLALPIPGIMQRKQVNSCSIVPLPHSSPIVGVADPWHYAAQTGELLLDRAPSLTHPRLLALPIPGIMQRKQVCSLCELLLDRRTFPQPNEIVAATDHSRAVTYTDSQNSSNDFISYQHHFVCSRKAIEITEGDDEEKLQRHEKREGGDENGVGGDEKGEGGDENGEGGDENGEGGDENGEGGDENGEGGDENGEGGDEKGKEEMRMGKEEMRKGRRR
ncbi:hypothetical protein BLNAU_1109 [Blattamonas nauphoetae]|uniref:Uncharacterized protein n=1 Tax=Blattamonas nauphoetae TaxID=2049346 RepID=A0ABQ9YJW7_9EUKA|nr:hypothetical protein BLNAU_1109 [Blattamonas nauphoetae]